MLTTLCYTQGDKMSEVWPLDAKKKLTPDDGDRIGTFKCLLLMPFEKRFNQISDLIEGVVSQIVKDFTKNYGMPGLKINRLDWVDATGAIQQQIWQEIYEADLIFCDITGFNPNVMFELGVCAGWKEMKKIVLIRDHYFKQPSAFDIAPIRYTEYTLTSEGVNEFKEKIQRLVELAYISYPDIQGSVPLVKLPLEIDFEDNRDSDYIYTPPLAHRRVKDGALEFGSIVSYAHSWSIIGGNQFRNFHLTFSAKFIDPLTDQIYEKTRWEPGKAFIGIGLRSQHFYAGLAHILYLRKDGHIILSQPAEDFNAYKDITLRGTTDIDPYIYHQFEIEMTDEVLAIGVDDFEYEFKISELPKVYTSGYIRFQSLRSWMGIANIKLKNMSVT